MPINIDQKYKTNYFIRVTLTRLVRQKVTFTFILLLICSQLPFVLRLNISQIDLRYYKEQKYNFLRCSGPHSQPSSLGPLLLTGYLRLIKEGLKGKVQLKAFFNLSFTSPIRQMNLDRRQYRNLGRYERMAEQSSSLKPRKLTFLYSVYRPEYKVSCPQGSYQISKVVVSRNKV